MGTESDEFQLYKGKNLSSLFKDIVSNSENKRDQIDILISDLRSMIKTASDAMIIVPLLREYIDVGVKNDEQLIKLAAIVQRIVTNRATNGNEAEVGGFVLTDEERKQLEQSITEVHNSVTNKNV